MTTGQIALPPKLIPVFTGPAEVRGAYGGRGSGKTRSFATMAAVRAYQLAQEGQSGVILCGRQFQNSLADSSFAEVKLGIEAVPWLLPYFDIGKEYIRTLDGRINFLFGGLARNIGSIKSTARILLAWIDEAEDVTDSALDVLIPTIREENSELWVTWNPRRKGSAVDRRFRTSQTARTDPAYKVVELNWRDNPRFTAKLAKQRTDWLRDDPDSYEHVWEGDYASGVKGAYWRKQIAEAKAQGRIERGRVPPDDLMRRRVFCDIGGTGRQADAFSMWVAQFVGKEVRVIDYYEAQGQPLASHLVWLHERGHKPETTDIWLPHDGVTQDRVYDASFEGGFIAAGYATEVIPNQGRGAATQRIAAARRMWPAVWMDSEHCSAGLAALKWYHEKRDEERDVGLGPEHDWASHSADAFGLMALVYEAGPARPQTAPSRKRHAWRRPSSMAA